MATPELLDQIITNSLALRLHDQQFAAEVYAERFSRADGRVVATFEILTLIGWKPHPSQQQPLRPGSAAMRLADALGTTERSTGDKAGVEPGDEPAR